jgi:hypothetical protein
MGRMGHSTRATLIYKHRTAERDRLIASLMIEIVEAEMGDTGNPSGTQRAATPRMKPMTAEMNRNYASDQASRGGAGDENRTRTISLRMSDHFSSLGTGRL